jgi:Flp pilus assembly protein TadG
MVTHLVLPKSFSKLLATNSLAARLNRKGQAVVEFSLIFILLLIVAWIPADFGLAFYTGQLSLNAAREGARIAAAMTTFDAAAIADATTQTCKRLSSALLSDPGGLGISCSPYSNARVAVTAPAGIACNQQLTVTVTGNYNFAFYHFLRLLGATVPSFVPITRSTTMRWENQSACT